MERKFFLNKNNSTVGRKVLDYRTEIRKRFQSLGFALKFRKALITFIF